MPRLIFLMGMLLVLSHQAFGDFVFRENFDGYLEGSKAYQNIRDTDKSSAPVMWDAEAYTKIASPEAAKSLPGLASLTVKTNTKISANSIARTASGQAGLLFSYRAGINSWSEQRFTLNQDVLGKKGLSEIWIQYDMFIPSNFKALDANPTSGNYFGGGHKVLALYGDGYSGLNSTMVFGQLFARKGKDGTASPEDNNAYSNGTFVTSKDGKRIYTQLGVDQSRSKEAAWIFAKDDRGTWQRRTIHFKFPTSETSNDGVIEVWIKRPDRVYKMVDKKDGSFYGLNQNYFNAGYFNGWCNDGLDGDTYFFLDNVIITDNRVNLDETALIQVANGDTSPPLGDRPMGPQGAHIN